MDARACPHPVQHVELVQTRISWVLLAAQYFHVAAMMETTAE
jgi:aminoglycoside phosphotransferase family enzyme